jgi:hypothetical protein
VAGAGGRRAAVGVAPGAPSRRRQSHVAWSASVSERRDDAPISAPFRARKKKCNRTGVIQYATCWKEDARSSQLVSSCRSSHGARRATVCRTWRRRAAAARPRRGNETNRPRSARRVSGSRRTLFQRGRILILVHAVSCLPHGVKDLQKHVARFSLRKLVRAPHPSFSLLSGNHASPDTVPAAILLADARSSRSPLPSRPIQPGHWLLGQDAPVAPSLDSAGRTCGGTAPSTAAHAARNPRLRADDGRLRRLRGEYERESMAPASGVVRVLSLKMG